jgi:ectoine hydroxylase-related dioxygenase (phytanoyl-CoA dioxygenase family)
MSDDHLRQAVAAMREDGFVVLNGVVDTAHLDMLHARLLEDLEALQRRADTPYNWNTGNVQQDPPPFPPYLFKDVLVNEMVIAVTRAVLGPGVKSTFYSGNTAIKSEERQPVHADTGNLWPGAVLECPHPAAQIVINVPTVDVSPENGSTEIWPGTHRDLTLDADKDIKVPGDALERRRAVVPPIQPSFKRGGVLLRDIRLWHAGMPNRTDAPRPMIAMIHNCGWLGSGESLTFPKGTEAFFKHPELRTVARFVEGPIDHISTPHAYEYEAPK